MAAGALAPTIVVGLLWRKPGEYTYENSMVTPAGAKTALIARTLTAILAGQNDWVTEVFGGPVILAAVVATLYLIIISNLTRKS